MRGVAQWDMLRSAGSEPQQQPSARCYHSAALWGGADPNVLLFGGAGEGSALFDDTWVLEEGAAGRSGGGGGGSGGGGGGRAGAGGASDAAFKWRQLEGLAQRPAPRSSHLCASWKRPDGSAVVVHGGLGNGGVTSDLWLLPPPSSAQRRPEWVELQTSGVRVARAHHCGGVVGERLLVYSGQDDSLLTVGTICSVGLRSCVWEEIGLGNFGGCGGYGGGAGPSSRIDAAAACVGGVGLLVFGGVGSSFEHVEPDDTWLVSVAARTEHGRSGGAPPAPRRICAAGGAAPSARACHAMCASGLHVYAYGGFDGVQDRDELWCLSLVPDCFEGEAALRVAGSSSDFEQAEFRARQARQAAVLHQTPAAAGHNTMHLRVLGQAAREAEAARERDAAALRPLGAATAAEMTTSAAKTVAAEVAS